jgi:hypothetical protein
MDRTTSMSQVQRPSQNVNVENGTGSEGETGVEMASQEAAETPGEETAVTGQDIAMI